MTTTDDFNGRVEAAVKSLLLGEYPHMKTSSLNRISDGCTQIMAALFQEESRADSKGVRPLKFLDLPREIRDTIYEYAVTPSDGLGIPLNYCRVGTFCRRQCDITHSLWDRKCKDVNSRPGNMRNMQPAVTRVSKQLRHEALPLFYKSNDFHICLGYERSYRQRTALTAPPQGTELLCKWLRAIGPANVANIRKLSIHYTREIDKQALLDMNVVPEQFAEFRFMERKDRR